MTDRKKRVFIDQLSKVQKAVVFMASLPATATSEFQLLEHMRTINFKELFELDEDFKGIIQKRQQIFREVEKWQDDYELLQKKLKGKYLKDIEPTYNIEEDDDFITF